MDEEKRLRALIRLSTTTTMGLKTKMLVSKFLLLKGTKQGIFFFFLFFGFLFLKDVLDEERERIKPKT